MAEFICIIEWLGTPNGKSRTTISRQFAADEDSAYAAALEAIIERWEPYTIYGGHCTRVTAAWRSYSGANQHTHPPKAAHDRVRRPGGSL